MSELHGDDAQVASSDQPTEPAGHRGPAHHPHLKHLPHNQQLKLTAIRDSVVFTSLNKTKHQPEEGHQASRPQCSL